MVDPIIDKGAFDRPDMDAEERLYGSIIKSHLDSAAEHFQIFDADETARIAGQMAAFLRQFVEYRLKGTKNENIEPVETSPLLRSDDIDVIFLQREKWLDNPNLYNIDTNYRSFIIPENISLLQKIQRAFDPEDTESIDRNILNMAMAAAVYHIGKQSWAVFAKTDEFKRSLYRKGLYELRRFLSKQRGTPMSQLDEAEIRQGMLTLLGVEIPKGSDIFTYGFSIELE